jgi:biopolymer transport protein ExbD
VKFERCSLKNVSFEALLAWPFLNVVLIFFLMWSFRPFFFAGEAGLDLRLPTAVSRTPADRASFVVIVDAEGHLYWQGRMLSVDDFQKKLSRSADSPVHVLLKADRRASLDVLSSVWEACRKAGVARVTMATNG